MEKITKTNNLSSTVQPSSAAADVEMRHESEPTVSQASSTVQPSSAAADVEMIDEPEPAVSQAPPLNELQQLIQDTQDRLEIKKNIFDEIKRNARKEIIQEFRRLDIEPEDEISDATKKNVQDKIILNDIRKMRFQEIDERLEKVKSKCGEEGKERQQQQQHGVDVIQNLCQMAEEFARTDQEQHTLEEEYLNQQGNEFEKTIYALGFQREDFHRPIFQLRPQNAAELLNYTIFYFRKKFDSEYAFSLDGPEPRGPLIDVSADIDELYHMRQDDVWDYLMSNGHEKVMDMEDEEFKHVKIRRFYQNNRDWQIIVECDERYLKGEDGQDLEDLNHQNVLFRLRQSSLIKSKGYFMRDWRYNDPDNIQLYNLHHQGVHEEKREQSHTATTKDFILENRKAKMPGQILRWQTQKWRENLNDEDGKFCSTVQGNRIHSMVRGVQPNGTDRIEIETFIPDQIVMP